MDFEILPFTEEHVEEIYEIEKLCFATPWDLQSIREELNNAFAKYFVAVYQNKVIGYAGLWNIVDEGHITNIAVHPEYQGVGIGDGLLNKLIEICKKKNIHSLTLEVRESNYKAQNLYKKYGFVVEGIRKKYYSDNDENALIMWKYN